MKVITLWQPWASWYALGLKEYETRHWSTSYRGVLAIHAAVRHLTQADRNLSIELMASLPHAQLNRLKRHLEANNGLYPYGQILGYGDLPCCKRMVKEEPTEPNPSVIGIRSVSNNERLMGNWSEGRFAWQLAVSNPLARGIPFKGSQGLRTLAPAIAQQLIDAPKFDAIPF